MGAIIWAATIPGEPASKANSRRLVTIQGRPRSIKAKKALDWVTNARAAIWNQTAIPDRPYPGPVAVIIDIYYASARPDLDESLVLDVLQPDKRTGFPGVIVNDRMVVRKYVAKHLDRENPRAVITVRVADDTTPLHRGG